MKRPITRRLGTLGKPGMGVSGLLDSGFRELVIVAPACDRFDEFVAAGSRGEVGLHFCVDGVSALRMARRFRADVWLVALDLPDMSGLDLLEMLVPLVSQGRVDPHRGGAVRDAAEADGTEPRSGVFVIADAYALDDEQRALRAGAAGYLVAPVSLMVFAEARRAAAPRQAANAKPQAR
ncbi:MAG: hypothetical protein ACKO4T_08400 [Planctomycetaceae bacterium]